MSQAKSDGANHDEVLNALEGKAIMFDVLKGGYGKSALSLNLADRLAARGHDVLYVDLDPNGHITFSLGFDDVYNDAMHDYGFVATDIKYYGKETLEPEDLVYETDFAFDFCPSYDDMESFEGALDEMNTPQRALADEFLYPLYAQGKYDYFILDGGGERSRIADCGFFAGRTAMIPLAPGNEALSAWRRTWNRVIGQLESVGFNILAVIPNMLSQRIDHQNHDRELLENLNNSKQISPYLPSFARIDDWEKVDRGDYDTLPGIREREAIQGGIATGQPAAHYDPDCDQIEHFDELARIVEQGGI